MHDALFWLFPLVLVGTPWAYLILQVWALWRWRGGFRLAAALPILGWLPWAVKFVSDVSQDPTSHNLFPFEILMGAAAALAYLVLLAGLRRLAA